MLVISIPTPAGCCFSCRDPSKGLVRPREPTGLLIMMLAAPGAVAGLVVVVVVMVVVVMVVVVVVVVVVMLVVVVVLVVVLGEMSLESCRVNSGRWWWSSFTRRGLYRMFLVRFFSFFSIETR